MKNVIDFRNSEECRNLRYKDFDEMTLDDALYIISEPVQKYHEAKNDNERINLPRPRLIKAYELLIDAAGSPNMRDKVNEYISELDKEIKRCMELDENVSINFSDSLKSIALQIRIDTLEEVKNDLQSRLEEP